jgi:hypothetical protein
VPAVKSVEDHPGCSRSETRTAKPFPSNGRATFVNDQKITMIPAFLEEAIPNVGTVAMQLTEPAKLGWAQSYCKAWIRQNSRGVRPAEQEGIEVGERIGTPV